jgi:hypothetical protein
MALSVFLDYAEDGNRRADPGRQGQDCCQGKAWSSCHLPKGEAQVLQQPLHESLLVKGEQPFARSQSNSDATIWVC